MSNGTRRLQRNIFSRRNPLLWPFAAESIWNMPIGTSAIYIPLNLSPPLIGYSTDEAYLCFTPTAPFRRLYDRGYW